MPQWIEAGGCRWQPRAVGSLTLSRDLEVRRRPTDTGGAFAGCQGVASPVSGLFFVDGDGGSSVVRTPPPVWLAKNSPLCVSFVCCA